MADEVVDNHPLVVPFLEAREAYVSGNEEPIFKAIDLVLGQLDSMDKTSGGSARSVDPAIPDLTSKTKKTSKDDKKLTWRMPERGQHYMFMKKRD